MSYSYSRRFFFLAATIFIACFRFSSTVAPAQRASHALRAASRRSSGVIFAARALPPFFPPLRPSATAAGSLLRFLAMRGPYHGHAGRAGSTPETPAPGRARHLLTTVSAHGSMVVARWE